MTMKAVVKLFVVCCGILMGVSSFSLVANAADNERIMIHGDDPNLDPAIKRILVVAEDSYAYYRQKGMIGLENASKECYIQTQGSVECLYIDATAHLIDKKFLEALKKESGMTAPADPYFEKQAILDRAKPYFNGSSTEQQEHWSALTNLLGQLIDGYIQQDAKFIEDK